METVGDFLDVVLGLSATKAEQLGSAQVCARAFVVYVVLIAYIRIAKKRFLSEATAFDAVLVIVIGSLASRAISGSAPFVASLAGTLTLILFHWLASYLTSDSPSLSHLLKGSDTVLVRNGKIDRKALKASHMSIDDLEEDLRQKGLDDVSSVKSARLERSGQLSVIKK